MAFYGTDINDVQINNPEFVLYGGGGNDIINTTNGSSFIAYGGIGDDSIFLNFSFALAYMQAWGGQGNDVLYMPSAGSFFAGSNLYGDEGNDIIIAGKGPDHLEGGSGIDALYGGMEDDVIYGGDGDDSNVSTFTAGSTAVANYVITATAGLYGDEGADYLDGGRGNDYLNGGADNDDLYGGSGNDVLDGGIGVDYMEGGTGDDKFYVDNAGDVVVEGGSAVSGTADYIYSSISYTSTLGAERLYLTGGGNSNATGSNGQVDFLVGNMGANTLNGGVDGFADILMGGTGNDFYIINTANDNIFETAGGGTADRAKINVSFALAAGDNIEILETTSSAGTSSLVLTGNEIAQLVIGNAGSNVINGMLGNDTLTGGLGSDFFVFNTLPNAATNRDTITDYNVAADTIRLENTGVFTALGLATGVLNVALFKNLTTGGAVDASDRILYNDATGQVFYDTDGSGASAAVQFATITGAPTLTNTDFVVI